MQKVIVITGASRGLGEGMAAYFHAQGHKLGLCARHRPSLTGAKICSCALDISDAVAVAQFADEVTATLGEIDLWINNAGLIEPIQPLTQIDTAAFERIFQVNVMGVLHASRAYLARRQQTDGVLINISSGAAQRGYAGWGAYCASKAAVDRLSEALAAEQSKVRVYAVAPGVIDTDMQGAIRRCDATDFPNVEYFRQLKRDEAFNSPQWVAKSLWDIAFGAQASSQSVVLRVADEKQR